MTNVSCEDSESLVKLTLHSRLKFAFGVRKALWSSGSKTSYRKIPVNVNRWPMLTVSRKVSFISG